MKSRFWYFIPALAFAVFAALQYNDPDPLYWMGIYLYVSLANVLAALNKLNYTVIFVGFLGMLFLVTQNFPEVEQWSFDSEESKEILGLIVGCNWIAMLGIIKLYKETYPS